MRKQMFFVALFIVALLGFAISVHAQTPTVKPFRVGQGSITGTYGQAFNELQNACSTDSLPLLPSFPDGKGDGLNNLESLVNGESQAAFVRNDVIFFQNQGGQLNYIKTLFTLWPETVHIVTLTTSKTLIAPEKWKPWSKVPLQINSLYDLAGYRLGAPGANKITSNVIKAKSGVDFQIVELPNAKAAFDALDSGQVEAIIFTAGKPLPNLQKLDTTYKIVAIPADLAAKMSMVYRPSTITYSNLNASSIPSVDADAIFVVRQVETMARKQQLSELRTCFFNRLAELKDEGSPRWQVVDPNNKGKWEWYDLPVTAPVKKAVKK